MPWICPGCGLPVVPDKKYTNRKGEYLHERCYPMTPPPGHCPCQVCHLLKRMPPTLRRALAIQIQQDIDIYSKEGIQQIGALARFIENPERVEQIVPQLT